VTQATTSRRDRLRAATIDEIKSTARRLLVSDGVSGVSLRAIGREMGMTAAALYRYYPSLEALVAALCVDLFDECSQSMELARDGYPHVELADRLYAVCREFRRWSVAHPAEFGLMFGSPLPNVGDPVGAADLKKHAAGARFSNVFAESFAGVWQRAPFPVPSDDELSTELRQQLRTYLDGLGTDLPLGAAQIFLSSWIRLYGLVALEVFGHLRFALTDVEPMFEAELSSLARLLKLDRPVPPKI
jgi:AcrR family transcriptional regulator